MTEEEGMLALAKWLGVSHMGKARRIYNDVKQAAKIFTRQPALRPAARLRELRDLLAYLETRPNWVDEIDPRLFAALGISEEFEEEALRSNPSNLLEAVRSAVSSLEEDCTTQLDQRGGRAADSRLGGFAAALAIIYEEYAGKAPTFTINKNDGGFDSPFSQFAEEAFAQFCPDALHTAGAVRKALQEAAQSSMFEHPIEDNLTG